MNAAIETEAYQTLLEGHRHDPDNDELYEDMLKAKAAMEIAWLNHTTQEQATRDGKRFEFDGDGLELLRRYRSWSHWKRWLWRKGWIDA